MISQQDIPECLLTNLGKYQLEGHPSNIILSQADLIMSIYPGPLIRFLINCGTTIQVSQAQVLTANNYFNNDGFLSQYTWNHFIKKWTYCFREAHVPLEVKVLESQVLNRLNIDDGYGNGILNTEITLLFLKQKFSYLELLKICFTNFWYFFFHLNL